MNLRRLSSVSLGHMAIDTLNASIAMILTVLAVPFDLSNSQIGLGVMVYTLLGSLSQPYFGWLADRMAGRWLGAVGLLWTALFYFAATYSQNYATLIVLMAIASLGSAAFHPQGAMNASVAGQRRASSATAIFFLLGQMGLAFGPMLAGFLLERIGMLGPRIMAVASLPFVALMAIGLNVPVHREQAQEWTETSANALSISVTTDRRWLILAAFAVLVATRSTVQQGYYGLLPKFFADQGYSPGDYGFMVGLFSVALAVGTLSGGFLGDRFDQSKVLVWTLLVTAPFTWAMLQVEGVLYFVLAALAGFLVGVPHSILIVMAQRLLPQRQGLASGAVLGFMFACGAAGIGLAGWIADYTGMAAVVNGIALLPVIAAACAFLMAWHRTAAAQMEAVVTASAD